MNKLEFLNRAVEIVKMAKAKSVNYEMFITNDIEVSECSHVKINFSYKDCPFDHVVYCDWKNCEEGLDIMKRALNEYEAI